MPKIVTKTKMMILVLRARQKRTRAFATRFAVVVLVSPHSCGKGDNHQRESEGSPLQRDLVLECSCFFRVFWHLLTSLQFSKQEYVILVVLFFSDHVDSRIKYQPQLVQDFFDR